MQRSLLFIVFLSGTPCIRLSLTLLVLLIQTDGQPPDVIPMDSHYLCSSPKILTPSSPGFSNCTLSIKFNNART